MTQEATWPGEWLRGVLGVAVLAILTQGPTYGYAIATALSEAGFGVVKGGTLYPLLGRLEEAGHVQVEWRPGEGGPGRKFYALTDSGHRHARAQAELWSAFTRTTVGITDLARTTTTTLSSKEHRP